MAAKPKKRPRPVKLAKVTNSRMSGIAEAMYAAMRQSMMEVGDAVGTPAVDYTEQDPDAIYKQDGLGALFSNEPAQSSKKPFTLNSKRVAQLKKRLPKSVTPKKMTKIKASPKTKSRLKLSGAAKKGKPWDNQDV